MDSPNWRNFARKRISQPDGGYVVAGLLGMLIAVGYTILIVGEVGGWWKFLLDESVFRDIARWIGGFGIGLVAVAANGMAWHLVRGGLKEWRLARKGAGLVSEPKVEKIGVMLSFLVPRRIRKSCFEPFFEDLKADRLERIARSRSRGVKRWVEFCFYFRLCVTVVQSLGCFLGETLSKLAPFIRALFFKGG